MGTRHDGKRYMIMRAVERSFVVVGESCPESDQRGRFTLKTVD